MKYIKQYGCHRSGTNFLKMLIEENFDNTRVLNLILGSKHSPFNYEEALKYEVPENKKLNFEKKEIDEIKNQLKNKELFFVVIIKNPYSWLASYHKYRSMKKKQNIILTDKLISKWLGEWHKKNTNWLNAIKNYNSDKAMVITYDDLILNPKRYLSRMERKFSLQKKYEKFLTGSKFKMIRGTDNEVGKQLESKKIFKKKKYLEKSYLENFSEKNLKQIKDIITGKEYQKIMKLFPEI
jgi:hypothetical protein